MGRFIPEVQFSPGDRVSLKRDSAVSPSIPPTQDKHTIRCELYTNISLTSSNHYFEDDEWAEDDKSADDGSRYNG